MYGLHADRTMEEAERAGYHAARDGANQINSHFTFFATPELTRAWDRGNARGKAEKET